MKKQEWYQQPPIIERHEVRGDPVYVVREDLIHGGSKIRFLPYLVGGASEIVFGGPFCGGAPLALSVWGKRKGVKISLFYAKRKQLHRRQLLARENGAIIHEVEFGYMSHVQAKAKAYAERAGALFLPLGFDVKGATEPFVDIMRAVRKALPEPVEQVWCATGSGMLARCLSEAFRDSAIYGVAVGLASRHEAQSFKSNVTILPTAYKFEQETKGRAPFPSCGNYDRKAWELCAEYGTGPRLFWNVLS